MPIWLDAIHQMSTTCWRSANSVFHASGIVLVHVNGVVDGERKTSVFPRRTTAHSLCVKLLMRVMRSVCIGCFPLFVSVVVCRDARMCDGIVMMHAWTRVDEIAFVRTRRATLPAYNVDTPASVACPSIT